MPNQQLRRSTAILSDEDMPTLRSPSISSESEPSPIIPPRPTTSQQTVLPRRSLADVFDSDDSDMDITESDVRFARGLLRQFQQYANSPASRSNPPGGNGAGNESSRLLESLYFSSSSEDEDDQGNRRTRSRNRRTNSSPEEMRNQINDIIQQFVSFSDRMREDVEREPDHLRAHAIIDGLEHVPKGLLLRYEVIKGEDHPKRRASCAVCYEPLGLDRPHEVEDNDPTEPIRTENKKLFLALPYHAAFPEVVAFPCLHLFHSECLLPWLARKTTCPTCRFDVDPHSLTLKGGDAKRPWVPPVEGVLEAWVRDEETKKFPNVKHVLSIFESEVYLSEPEVPPLGSGYESDESTSSVGSFRTCFEGDQRVF